MQLLAPEAAIGVKHHQERPFRLHQAGRHKRHKLEKTTEVGEAAQGKPQRSQEFLVAALLAAEAVEQLPHRGQCRWWPRCCGAVGVALKR